MMKTSDGRSFTIRYINGVLMTIGQHFTHSKETSVPF